MVDIQNIETFLNDMKCISRVSTIDSGDSFCTLSIDVSIPGLDKALPFDVILEPWYPSKACGSESIHFVNKDLIEYPHIMEGGSLCLHTISSPDWREKLTSDIEQLCQWIQDYYIDGKIDDHFDHLVVNESVVDECYHSFNYAQTNGNFTNGESGYVSYKLLADGSKKGRTIKNYIAVNYHTKRTISHVLNNISPFSDPYASSDSCICSPYIVLDNIPGRYGKFIFDNYVDFESVVTQGQRKHILDFSEHVKRAKHSYHLFPLFIGYHIPKGNMAWNVAMVDINDFPTTGFPEYKDGHKTGRWLSRFKDQKIKWALTNDISPEYFFGRGCFPAVVTNKRILIMGLGAIGTMVANTLVRGGCNNIALYDFDQKEPGNICRSEYDFICPTDEKMNNLAMQLRRISPYVNIALYKERFDEYVKTASQQNSKIKEYITEELKENYDLIIDCTTDDDVMYALEQIKLPLDVINLSITNHAEELVCAFSPSIFEFVRGIYQHSVKNDPNDVFFPTGCWNPTFKATYNDIATKIQFALKRIIRMLSGDEQKQNFTISEDKNGLHFRPW